MNSCSTTMRRDCTTGIGRGEGNQKPRANEAVVGGLTLFLCLSVCLSVSLSLSLSIAVALSLGASKSMNKSLTLGPEVYKCYLMCI